MGITFAGTDLMGTMGDCFKAVSFPHAEIQQSGNNKRDGKPEHTQQRKQDGKQNDFLPQRCFAELLCQPAHGAHHIFFEQPAEQEAIQPLLCLDAPYLRYQKHQGCSGKDHGTADSDAIFHRVRQICPIIPDQDKHAAPQTEQDKVYTVQYLSPDAVKSHKICLGVIRLSSCAKAQQDETNQENQTGGAVHAKQLDQLAAGFRPLVLHFL